MLKRLLYVFCGALVCTAAFPNPVSFSTTGVGPLSFYADTFTLVGQSGTLLLSSSAVTTGNINLAQFFTGDSGFAADSETITLTYNLELDGVTHAISQSATWTIDPTLDTFVVQASGPVRFDLGADGVYDVTVDGYTMSNPTVNSTDSIYTVANFSPVAEPSAAGILSLLLFGFGIPAARRVFSAH